jgi:hypothetical protein
MSDRATYNGWSNYETWCVKLWIDQYRNWQEQARQVWDATDPDEVFNERSALARLTLANQLQSAHEDARAELFHGNANVLSDLLGAALSEVDWSEIADAMLQATSRRSRRRRSSGKTKN